MFMYIQELFLKKNSVSLKIESGDLNCKWSNIDIGVDETLPNIFFFLNLNKPNYPDLSKTNLTIKSMWSKIHILVCSSIKFWSSKF
jgi:hypothetical protein